MQSFSSEKNILFLLHGTEELEKKNRESSQLNQGIEAYEEMSFHEANFSYTFFQSR